MSEMNGNETEEEVDTGKAKNQNKGKRRKAGKDREKTIEQTHQRKKQDRKQ